ncbi:F-Box Only Protein 41 [Manis pentadactyla]|nr:F-Box Only Protein 41 [Manis pentadactyla]
MFCRPEMDLWARENRPEVMREPITNSKAISPLGVSAAESEVGGSWEEQPPKSGKVKLATIKSWQSCEGRKQSVREKEHAVEKGIEQRVKRLHIRMGWRDLAWAALPTLVRVSSGFVRPLTITEHLATDADRVEEALWSL